MNGTDGQLYARFVCTRCGTVHFDYIRSVNCCTWVSKLQDSSARITILQLETALQSGIPLRAWKAR